MKWLPDLRTYRLCRNKNSENAKNESFWQEYKGDMVQTNKVYDSYQAIIYQICIHKEYPREVQSTYS